MKLKFLAALGVLLPALLLGGCSNPTQSEEPIASLDLIEAYDEPLDDFKSLGVAIVGEPGSSVWDSPDGVTIGRIEPGSYAVYNVEDLVDEWLQIAIISEIEDLDEYNIKSGVAFGWIPNQNVDLIINSDKTN